MTPTQRVYPIVGILVKMCRTSYKSQAYASRWPSRGTYGQASCMRDTTACSGGRRASGVPCLRPNDGSKSLSASRHAPQAALAAFTFPLPSGSVQRRALYPVIGILVKTPPDHSPVSPPLAAASSGVGGRVFTEAPPQDGSSMISIWTPTPSTLVVMKMRWP